MTLPPLKRMNPRTVLADACTLIGVELPSPLKRLSKRGMVRIINARLAELELEPVRLGSSFAAIAAEVAERAEQIEGGGDDRPDWVPEGATHHVDLVRAFNDLDAAWTLADGIVAVDTLLGADANTNTGFGPSEYDPDNLTANGYSIMPGDVSLIALISSARTKVLSGSTFRIQMKDGDLTSSTYFMLISANGNAGIEVDLNTDGSLSPYSWAGSLSSSIPNAGNFAANVSVNVVAVTLTPTRLDYTANGLEPETEVLTETDFPTSGDDQLVAVAIDLDFGEIGGDRRQSLQSITLYDALPSTAGLSALSETGVVNTAPHIGTSGFFDAFPDGEIATLDTQSVLTTFVRYAGDVTDDEGNPVTLSVISDETGCVALSVDEGVQYDGNLLAEPLPPGDYDIVVRAEDPGGLYVEQEFTITVTA